ncbi:MAG: nucleotide exchange factor GrpE [Clostridia bacterium]|nr:nucleotide exchange factor GrpE [Clostridia bacterium]
MTEEIKETLEGEEIKEEATEETVSENEAAADAEDEKKVKSERKYKKEAAELKKEVETLTAALAEEKDRYMRMLAEYDNFRKRSAKDRESAYGDAYTAVVTEILPVIDNLERALAFSEGETLTAGVEMTLKQFKASMEKLGISEIECVDFDPNLHNAVMHVEDDSVEENKIVEVFQKGFRKGDKVIRFAMVKVAN